MKWQQLLPLAIHLLLTQSFKPLHLFSKWLRLMNASWLIAHICGTQSMYQSLVITFRPEYLGSFVSWQTPSTYFWGFRVSNRDIQEERGPSEGMH